MMVLACEYQLTAYGAIYLELALRQIAALAMFDIKRADAMQCAGGTVFNARLAKA